jgi:hypothetical protein
MVEGGLLSDTWIASLVGVGAGRGIALVFLVSAFFLWCTSLYAFANSHIRNLETEIPDAISDEPISDPVIDENTPQGDLAPA